MSGAGASRPRTRRCMAGATLLLGCLAGGAGAAHEVVHQIAVSQTMTVQLRYADGEPFAFETYTLYPDSAPMPTQTGRTDAQGRIAFFADQARRWRLRAFSADGHGVDLTFDTLAVDARQTVVHEASPARSSRLLFGTAIILATFGAMQLYFRKRQ